MANAKERYDKLQKNREQFLQRARHNAMLTIPSLMPLAGHDGRAHLIEPYQSDGAAGVVSISSRVTMALIPAGRPHLRMEIKPEVQLELGGDVPPEVEQNLTRMEQLIQKEVEAANWRARTLDSMQQLVVAGSVTEEYLDDNTIRVHRLDNFVWRRDFRGLVLECVIREYWDRDALPAGMAVGTQTSALDQDDEAEEVYIHIRYDDSGDVPVYTVTRENSNGSVFQENVYPAALVPFLFLRWSSTPGEDYGRAKVEEVIGDLRSLDSLSKQRQEQAAMASMNFVMIRPGANANGLRNRLARMANGDYLVGDPESVEVKQFANGPGYQITSDSISVIRESIARAFLLLAPQQRNAERVTATEIERDVQELESTLGGTFSSLSLEMLERRTLLLIESMKAQGKFPDEVDQLDATILTGLEALSRERDVGRGVQAAQIVSQFGEIGLSHIKFDVVLSKIMTGLGFPDAVKSAEEVAKEQAQAQQAAQQQAMMQAAAGPAAQAIAKQAGGSE